MRTTISLIVCGCFWSLSSGCSHMTETRVVRAFAESLKEHDLNALKAQSSSEFEQKAVHGDDTFRALKLIDVPEGEHKVVKVVDKKDDKKNVVEKRVTAEVGNKKTGTKKVLYLLKRDADNRKWVVDDMYLSKSDLSENKSMSARLAVLVSLREALDAWETGERDRILLSATPEFAQALNDLSPKHLERFAKKVTTDVARQTRILPKERIGDETAEMRLPRLDGELVLSFRKLDQRWKLDDLQVESRRGEDVASVRQVSAAMSAAISFQAAYRASDKHRLKQVATPRFFNGSLAAADLSLVTLPGVSNGDEEFDVNLEGGAATFVVRTGPEVVKLSLLRQTAEQIHTTPKYQVDDVTIYEVEGSQDKRLSALFTGHASMHAFREALAARDIKSLRAASTHDFDARVWSLVKPEHLARLPLGELPPVAPRIIQTSFKGSLAEILVEQGDTPATYVLRDEGGKMLVDDILLPVSSRPESLKANLVLILPVVEFTLGLEHSDMVAVRGRSTEEFSRLSSWNFREKTPEFDHDPFPHLEAPLTRVDVKGEFTELLLGTDRHGALVRLMKEDGRLKIDDITLIAGPLPEQRVALRRAIRNQVVNVR
jgi:hypothetical protein